jgi:hypothetical protein
MSKCNIWRVAVRPSYIQNARFLKVNTYGTAVLLVVSYGSGTWSLTLREERTPRAFENSALRKIFVSKTDNIIEDWRRQHNEKLHELYSSSSVIRVIK